MQKHEPIPKDFAVQPITTDKAAKDASDLCTCGYCELSWDDHIPTSYTPTPAGRCPFEYFHTYTK